MQGCFGPHKNSDTQNIIRRFSKLAGQKRVDGDGKYLFNFKAQESLSKREKGFSNPGNLMIGKPRGTLKKNPSVDLTGQSKQTNYGTKLKGIKGQLKIAQEKQPQGTTFGDEQIRSNNLSVDYRKMSKPPTTNIGTKGDHDAKDHFQQEESTVCEQLSERGSSFCSVRQSNEEQADSDYSSVKYPRRESKLPPVELNRYANSQSTQHVSLSLHDRGNNQHPEFGSFCSVRPSEDTKVSLQNVLQIDKNNIENQLTTPKTGRNNTDLCATCLKEMIFSTASYHCSNCGPFGRYLCQECSGGQCDRSVNHSLQSLSAIHYRSKDKETNLKQDMDTERNEMQNHEPYLKFIKDISIKTDEDEQPCQITGFCQLQNGTIVLTEMNNKSVKSLDCQKDKVIDTLNLSNYPMDICSTGGSDALVLTNGSRNKCHCVCIYVTHDIKQKQIQTLEHDGYCIAFSSGKTFIVTSKGIYIYDENWSLTDTISKPLLKTVDIILSNQVSIAVFGHDDVTTMYIADEKSGMHSIEDTNSSLTAGWKFKDHKNFNVTGMCCNSKGDILLIDRGYQRLIQMNSEGIILAILLDYHDKDGSETLNIPFHDKKNNNLIVSLSGADIIRVYDFK